MGAGVKKRDPKGPSRSKAEFEKGGIGDACRERAERLASRFVLATADGGTDAGSTFASASARESASSAFSAAEALFLKTGRKGMRGLAFIAMFVCAVATAGIVAVMEDPSIVGPYSERGLAYVRLVTLSAWFTTVSFAAYSIANAALYEARCVPTVKGDL